MTMLILFGSLLFLIFMSIPIGLSIGISSIITILFSDRVDLSVAIQKLVTSLDSFPLMAIPLFLLAGLLMGKGGIAEKILNLANLLVGWLAGGLAMVTVVASAFFAALSGSGMASVGAIGSFMIPSMKEKNYGAGFSSAITAAAGCIGVIIPPSIPLILYGVVTGESIGDLFLAGILPGIFFGVALMVYSYIRVKSDKTIKSNPVEKVSFISLLKAIYEAKWAILAPIIILGGIYAGIFTPTEAAAVAIVYSYIIGTFVHKDLNNNELIKSFKEAITLTGTTMYLLGVSMAFSYLLSVEQIPRQIAEGITNITENGIILMLLINIFLLIVGAFVDTVPAIVMLTPILLPVATEAGFDPIHFGVIVVVNLAIGYVTPPFGANLFLASIVGKTKIENIIVAMIPIITTLIIALLVIVYFEPLTMIFIN